MFKRIDTQPVYVGGIQIGGQNNVVIQSMTNTKTKDVVKTINQIKKLENAGCEIVRIAVLDNADADSIKEIKNRINIPLVADIHFNYRFVLTAVNNGVDKIRINPGNIGNDERVKEVVIACKKAKIPIRIGINSGSVEKTILKKYGHPTSEAMMESAKYHVNLLEKYDFRDIVLSFKSSDTLTTIETNKLAAKNFSYPLHVGITEAGTKFSGTIKSSIGLGAILQEGIGDTVRVSLSDDPVEEIYVAKEILKTVRLINNVPSLISCPTCGRLCFDLIPVAQEMEKFLRNIKSDITVAIMGCAVNGPGEAKEADIAVAGGKEEGLLIKKGKIIKKIKQEEMISVLKKEILNMTKNGKNV